MPMCPGRSRLMNDSRATNETRRRWQAVLERAMLRHRSPLMRRIARWAAKPSDAEKKAIDAALERSLARAAERAASVPAPRFPEELPVSALRGEIAAAIEANQVVIVSGETGSGKTTQLPKIC